MPLPESTPHEPAEGEGDDLGILCPRCASGNAPQADFCARCAAPLSLMSTLDPFKRTLAAGALYRQAAEGTPKLIGIVGIWLLFLPFLAALPVALARGEGSAPSLALPAVVSLFAAGLLWRATAGFRQRRREEGLRRRG